MYSLAELVAASSQARYCTPAQFDYALASGATDKEARLMLVSGASWLMEAEALADPEGTVLSDLGRRERILDHVLPEVHLRRLEASLVDFHVHEHGDDEVPPHVVYGAHGSTGAAWADAIF